MKVLVVDDVAYNRKIVELTLSRVGHQVCSAAGGAEALKILDEDPNIAVVVCDLRMPGMDGIELLRNCKNLEHWDDSGRLDPPPFILLTQSQDVEKLQTARELGFRAILTKPLDPALLLEKIGEIDASGCSSDPDIGNSMKTIDNLVEKVLNSKDKHSAMQMLKKIEESQKRISDFLKTTQAKDASSSVDKKE
jgi:CheY-like chemotaxis protein